MDRAVLDRLAGVAGEQHWLFSVAQALDAGATPTGLEWCLHRGWLRRVRRNVLAFAGAPATVWEPAIAAALACPGAVLSHGTAGAIHGFDGMAVALPEVTVDRASRACLAGVRTHYEGPLEVRDRVCRRGVEVTSPTRTLVDLAGAAIGTEFLAGVLDDGIVRRMWTAAEVGECLDRQPWRRVGARRLRDLLAVRTGEAVPDSRLEQRILRYLTPLAPFQVHHQLVVDGVVLVVDVAWPACRVAAEIDGRTYRVRSRSAFDRESRKLNLLAGADWRVAHLTATMSAEECRAAVGVLMPADGVRPGGGWVAAGARRR